MSSETQTQVLNTVTTSYREQLYDANKTAIENEIKFERMKAERDFLHKQLMEVERKLEKVKDETLDLKIQARKQKDSEKKPYIHTIFGDWEEVYSVQDVSSNLWTENLPLFHENTKYYQTYGGGPEGGYFVKDQRVWKVRRSWYQPWTIEKLENTVLEYEPEDEMAGQTARCRLLEVANLTESYHLNKEHSLWGNAIEIVKCLRDGLGRAGDASYKDLCLGIILNHFVILDKYLDLLPKDTAPSYKEVLENLNKRHQDEEDEESEAEEPICEECKSVCKTLHQKCDGTEAQDVSFVCDVCVKKSLADKEDSESSEEE